MTDIIPLKQFDAAKRLQPTGNKVGLLAGAGRFPILFAKEAQKQGYSVHAMGVIGMVSDELPEYCDVYSPVPLARIGQAIRWFKRHRVEQMVMAGKIEKVVLFQDKRLWRLLPDMRTIHMWMRYARENKKDDTLLLAVIREFERDQIHFASALDFCPELLVQHGFLTRRKPTAAQWKDICFGWDLAKEMGRLDVGQTVIVNDTAVIAIEAIEGTDKAILRAGELCKRGGFTVVKVAKPQQDYRFDVPTIGVQTLRSMHEAGGRVLAVEAGQTIILDEPEVVELADKLGISIVSLNSEEARLRIAC
ncbi:LpxI family protein [Rubinisphaera sp. JC750]|uniref:LpxI family protein n=1 Tax=Rubinisphaera sp. JC750 TaxID=2898658 RepID=UPI001F317E5F|nr:UDP-2,3-diacylglucosamine diphosphatase LpxI [Rubinisphaera sp. JC750]